MPEKSGQPGQPKTYPTPDAIDGNQGYLPTSQDEQTGTGTQNLPLPVTGHKDNTAESGLGGGYHLYPYGKGISCT